MAYLTSWHEGSWLKMLADDQGASFPLADLWGMPTWLVIAIVVLLVLALVAWFAVGSDVRRYLRIRNM